MDISGLEYPMPRVSGMSFEANQRQVAGTTRFFGVVTDFDPLDFPTKDRQNGRIQIEDEAAGRMRQIPDFPAQQVVHTDDTFSHYTETLLTLHRRASAKNLGGPATHCGGGAA
mgnify:CR=1 FL=1